MKIVRLLAALVVGSPLLAACAPVTATQPPSCGATERLGLVAQAVPSATYVPCLHALPAGWTSENFTVRRGSASFRLLSDRASGRAVAVEFGRRCEVADAVPFPPRTAGGRSYLLLREIRPRFTGSLLDVFPGGCVRYRFDFVRGPHIALMAELQSAVGFVSRLQLRQELRHQFGVELGP